LNNAAQKTQVIYIKHMVSNRCISTVKEELEKLGANVQMVELGKATIIEGKKKINEKQLSAVLETNGFALIRDKEDQLVEQIKVAVIEWFYYGNNANTIIRNSDYLSDKLGLPYFHISKVFSDKTGTTLEKYIILVKIERVKELLSYDEMTLSEIAYMMGYSAVQYLSNQFKQVTGYTVTEYKMKKINDRKPLDTLLD
jgi:AraC family transcriptional regulator